MHCSVAAKSLFYSVSATPDSISSLEGLLLSTLYMLVPYCLYDVLPKKITNGSKLKVLKMLGIKENISLYIYNALTTQYLFV